jgi:hypothetical protein
MVTKRYNKKYLNKTKKRKYNNIESVYIKNDSLSQNEKRLSCFLINNDKIQNFAFKIFYYMLNYWKRLMPKKWSSLIKHSLIEEIKDNDILKIGFTKTEINTIIKLVNEKNKLELKQYLKPKFLKVTSCINKLVEPEYTIYHVNSNKKLQKVFISHLQNIMFDKNVTWKKIIQYYNSIKNKKEKQMYNFFVFDLIYGYNKDIDSIYRDNLGNMNFFRDRLSIFKHDKQNYKKINECNKSIIDKDNYNEYGIYNSTERYKIQPNSPYAEIMKTNKQLYLGGPSGSAGLMYITLFQLYEFPFTYTNKIMLLGLLIADYVPLWHTISEILLTSYPEFKDSNINKYTLDKDPVLYSIKLLKPFIQ